MVGAGHGQGLAQAQGVCGVPGTGAFVCGHAGKPHRPGTGSKARAAAGVVGNYHFAGVKLIVFCLLFIYRLGFSLKSCTGSLLVYWVRRRLCLVDLRASFQLCLSQGEVLSPPRSLAGFQVCRSHHSNVRNSTVFLSWFCNIGTGVCTFN